MSSLRMSSAAKRDLFVIVCCSLVLCLLIDFRYDVSNTVLVRVDNFRNPAVNVVDEYGDTVKVHTSHKTMGKGKHSKPAVVVPPMEFDTRDRSVGRAKVVWGSEDVPSSTLVKHSPGMSVLDTVYFLNGTLYLVRSNHIPLSFPNVNDIISPDPSADKEHPAMKVITASQAHSLFGGAASRLEGTSFLCNHAVQSFEGYYPFTAEILFPLYALHSSTHTPSTTPQPRRLITPKVSSSQWRDYANMNQYILRGAFPSLGLEFRGNWIDRAEVGKPFVFDRVVLLDNAVKAKSKEDPKLQEGWWTPVRENVLTFAGTATEKREEKEKIVITYVQRQDWGKRMLRLTDHLKLSSELRLLGERQGWEVNIVALEKMSRDDQLQLAGRTTVLMGVHGAGLTSLLWMRPNEKTTVIEFDHPNSWEPNFETPARRLGIKHYTVWNNSMFTYPNLPGASDLTAQREFDSSDIPLDADAVVSLLLERLLAVSK